MTILALVEAKSHSIAISMLERYAPLPTKSYSRPLRKPTVAAMKQLVDSSNCH
jgi:hypothetical protein